MLELNFYSNFTMVESAAISNSNGLFRGVQPIGANVRGIG